MRTHQPGDIVKDIRVWQEFADLISEDVQSGHEMPITESFDSDFAFIIAIPESFIAFVLTDRGPGWAYVGIESSGEVVET